MVRNRKNYFQCLYSIYFEIRFQMIQKAKKPNNVWTKFGNHDHSGESVQKQCGQVGEY